MDLRNVDIAQDMIEIRKSLVKMCDSMQQIVINMEGKIET